jgi:telomerase reverse transcriptase
VFYYRHDVWRRVAEPAIAALKETILEEVKTADARRILGSRDLGYSHLRLLPKGQGMRPIMNLKRRQVKAKGQALGPSINTVLGPVHTLLKLEKVRVLQCPK